MTIHPMADQPQADKKAYASRRRQRVRDRAISMVAVLAILGVGAIAFASGHYVTDNKSQDPQTAGASTPPTIVPFDEGAPSDQ